MYLYIMSLVLLMRFMIWVLSKINWRSFKLNFLTRRIHNINSLFENNFIDPKVLFATRFKALANISLIKHIDTSKAYAMIMEKTVSGLHVFNHLYDFVHENTFIEGNKIFYSRLGQYQELISREKWPKFYVNHKTGQLVKAKASSEKNKRL